MDSPKRESPHDLPKELREVSIVKMTDPTAVRGSIEVLDQDVVNLDPKGFEVKRITVPLEKCCLIYSWSNSALRTRTLVHKDFDACTILGPRAHGSIDGAEIGSYAMIAAGPGAQGEIIVDSGYESVALLVPPKALRRHLDLRDIKRDLVVPEAHEIWHPTADVARDLFELGTRIADAAENAPEIFNDNHWARYGAPGRVHGLPVFNDRVV